MAIIETEQSKEIRLTQIERGPFNLRFASYRKNEDAKYNLRNEDYIVSDLTPSRAIFVLCDGVGSSFYGDIGSQILGELILNWLQKLKLKDVMDARESNSGLHVLVWNLQQELEKSVELATRIVGQKDIRTGKDDFTHLAERDQRDQFGTQSNFVGGIVWPAGKALPNGLVLLFWLGNARIRLFFQNTELPSLAKWGEDTQQQKEVWSSREGVVGQVYSFNTDLSKITSIIAYSDGLEGVENLLAPALGVNQFEELVRRAQSIKDDDISYLELTASQSQIVGSSDDISYLLRSHLNLPTQTSASVDLTPEIQALKRQVKNLTLKAEELSESYRSKQRLFKAMLLVLPILSLLFGCIAGSIIFRNKGGPDPQRTVTPYPAIVITCEICPTVIVTPSSTSLATDSFILIETSTPTSTETPIPSVTISVPVITFSFP